MAQFLSTDSFWYEIERRHARNKKDQVKKINPYGMGSFQSGHPGFSVFGLKVHKAFGNKCTYKV